MKFKVGDRVAVYEGYEDKKIGVVKKIMYSGDTVNHVRDHLSICFRPEYDFSGIYHYKQCRKLVNKKKEIEIEKLKDWFAKEIMLADKDFSDIKERLEKIEDRLKNSPIKCDKCEGTGKVNIPISLYEALLKIEYRHDQPKELCTKCSGKGIVWSNA